MQKFRKKPVVIEAIQITDATFDDPHPNPEHLKGVVYDPVQRCVFIETLEGTHRGDLGDWIIRGVKGELYPCKPDIFAATYDADTGAMTFGLAVEAMRKGKKVARSGWNGKGMFLFLVPGSTFTVNRPPLLGIYPEGTEINYCPHIDMRTADGKIVPWLASQTDALADDWNIVE